MRRLALALSLALLAPAAAERADGIELDGTWYVLVHYQDAASNKPEAWRWEDRVWRFAPEGERLAWTEWPIVVFDDESGRFESLGGSHAARVIAAWEPGPGQLADIHDGLQVNSRGVKTKTLRAADGAGAWRSDGAAAAGSASVITYSEEWSIEGLADKPVFTRADSLGGGSAESMEGTTVYRTEEVRDGGRELAGVFERDGSRTGRFRMIRSEETQKVRGSGLTQEQRLRQMFASQIGIQLTAEQIKAMDEGRAAPGAALPAEMRDEIRAQIRGDVEATLREQGEDPQAHAAEVDSLTQKIERLILDEGKSVDEVQRMLKAGEIQP